MKEGNNGFPILPGGNRGQQPLKDEIQPQGSRSVHKGHPFRSDTGGKWGVRQVRGRRAPEDVLPDLLRSGVGPSRPAPLPEPWHRGVK
jgi:hypothetical protein